MIFMTFFLVNNLIFNSKFELLGQAIQESPCEPKVDLKKLMETFSSDESKESKTDSSSSEEISEDELKAFDEGLTPLVTPSQKSKAMRILRAFAKGGTENQKNAAMVSPIIFK